MVLASFLLSPPCDVFITKSYQWYYNQRLCQFTKIKIKEKTLNIHFIKIYSFHDLIKDYWRTSWDVLVSLEIVSSIFSFEILQTTLYICDEYIVTEKEYRFLVHMKIYTYIHTLYMHSVSYKNILIFHLTV